MSATLNGQPMAEQEPPRRSNTEGMSERKRPREFAKPGVSLKRVHRAHVWAYERESTEPQSLKQFAKTIEEGRAWLARKKAA